MEGEKNNYRESLSMQERDRVGDMLVMVVLGVEKGQQAMAETSLPTTPPPLSSSTPRLTPNLQPTQPFSPHLIFVKAPQAPQYILEVIL